MSVPTLRSKRLILRALKREDAPILEASCSLEEVSRFLTGVPHPYPKNGARDWIDLQHKGMCGLQFAITWENAVIGITGLNPSSNKNYGRFQPSLGYWLSPSFWGKGIMTEATHRLLDWYMPIEPTERISAAVYEDNPRSMSILSKLGFYAVGKHKAFCPTRGEEAPMTVYELTAEKYLGMNA